MIHREALVVKKLNYDKNQKSELEIVLSDIIKVVKFVHSHSKKQVFRIMQRYESK